MDKNNYFEVFDNKFSKLGFTESRSSATYKEYWHKPKKIRIAISMETPKIRKITIFYNNGMSITYYGKPGTALFKIYDFD